MGNREVQIETAEGPSVDLPGVTKRELEASVDAMVANVNAQIARQAEEQDRTSVTVTLSIEASRKLREFAPLGCGNISLDEIASFMILACD